MIKTIIFDFGDIFLNLDKPATLREMEKYDVKDISETILNCNLDYEKGKITSADFLKTYASEYENIGEKEIITSWNAILVDFPEYRLDFIKKLSAEKKYKLILLSNTNEIHIQWVEENVPFFAEFKNCFDAFYLSHEINFRKPDAAIYEFVLKEHDLTPDECLFIDDTKENTDAAADLGIHTWNLDPKKQDIVDLFTVNGDLF